ncbi:MAG: formyl transferase [Chloroflexi bacterium]|nr:formyl transferase [Chloroflexota bacterium]
MPTAPLLILAERSATTYLLINALAAHFEIARVVFVGGHHGRKLLRYRLKRLGMWVVAGQIAFLVYDRLWIRPRSRKQIAWLLAGHDIRPPDDRLPVIEVESVNGPEVSTLISAVQPGAVVVSGTGIIARRVLALAPTFINIHCGITPRYRGVHGAYWAITEGRPDLAGTTVHLIDPGVDTGAILGQAVISIDPHTDTYRTLPVKQYLAGLPLMIAAVEAALADQLQPYQRDDLASQQWFSPTPGDHLRFRRQINRLRRAPMRSP